MFTKCIVIFALIAMAVAKPGLVVPSAAIVAPYATSYNSHTINHAIAHSVVRAAPLVAAAPAVVSSPYVASPYFASPYVSASPYFASPYAYSHYHL